jgi:SAM-dependent methyltransferase
VRQVTILEPSSGFAVKEIDGCPVQYVQPTASGVMPFLDNTFDVGVCLSVLHHIPNVSTVVGEMFRVMRPGGYLLLREPTHSMGDWRKPRIGLTKHERGIPAAIFRRLVREVGFEVVREIRCMFSLTSRLSLFTSTPVWTIDWVVRLDAALCAAPIWPRRYHALHALHKLRPTALAYVLRKPNDGK